MIENIGRPSKNSASCAEMKAAGLERIPRGFLLPSAAFTIKSRQVKFYTTSDKPPQSGDVIYGVISRIGEHSSLENASGRIHQIHDGTKAVFVFGNRYAPDYYEGLVPDKMTKDVDLLARSGMVGVMKTKNALIKDPTKVRAFGYVWDHVNEKILNTRDFSLIRPNRTVKKYPRSPMILICGTSMNSGKSMAAAACCWALRSLGYKVRACKVTGTASLKDILHMNDAGADPYADFTYLGHPSTYMLPEEELLAVFNLLDLKFANNPKNFWVVELADGVMQRETAILLNAPQVRERIHKLVFCASDAFGAIGGVRILAQNFNLVPDLLSGVCSSSPLLVRELSAFTDIPVFNSAEADVGTLSRILTSHEKPVYRS